MIELYDVAFTRRHHPTPILDSLCLRLADGERAVLLGGNGSGKTTLVRLLNGALLPTRGRIEIDGFDTRDQAAALQVRRRVGLLFQDPDNQFVTTTVEREVAFGLENLCVPGAEMRPAVAAALDRFDLIPHRHAPPHEMSGGEKARVALACVWVMGPRTLVLDETESLLDEPSRNKLLAAIDALPQDTSVLHVTTDVEFACTSSRVIVLHAGRIVIDGAPDSVWPQLGPEVVDRVGLPLVWRLAQRLCAAGCAVTPTASFDALLQQLPGSHGVRPP